MSSQSDVVKRIEKSLGKAKRRERELTIVLKGQYKEAYELLEDSESAGLTPAIVGPPGVGKTLLCRYYALMTKRSFYWITLDESTRPSHLIGTFNPAVVLSKGWCLEAFEPGPLTLAMVEGGVFVANELNRASEYTQNALLEPLEERSYYIPHLGRVVAEDSFFFIATMNPRELAGVHRLSEALRDRIHVWISLTYPKKEVEFEIIKANCPEYSLTDDILERIYRVVYLTRHNEQIVKPASIRSSIAMARLIAHALKDDAYDDERFVKIAFSVLSGAIRTKPGVRKDLLIRTIISEALRECR